MKVFSVSNFLKIAGILLLGAIGALIFNVFLLSYILVNPYFENFKFIRDFKQGKIVVNQTEQIYIQENNLIEESIQKVEKSIVAIESKEFGLKPGIIITSDGLMVTLANAIPASGKFDIFVGSEKVSFDILKIDSKNNLALIKINKNNLPTLGFADYERIKLGESVFIVAPISKNQDNWLANSGVIRQIDKNIIKTNIIEKPVATGSPLFNIKGELIGLCFIDADGKISAVSVQLIKQFSGL